MPDQKIEKLVIVGSGPAGLTAAIYAARGNLKPTVISGQELGGQLMITTDVDDFPSYPEGIQGPDLMDRMRKQAERFGTKFIDEQVLAVNFSSWPFTLTTDKQTVFALSVVIASGASAKWLGLNSEQKLRGKGVSACAVCDGPFFKDKKVVVVGGGDTAMREAQHLSKYASEVTIVHRRGEFRAQAALIDLVKSKSNVKFCYNSIVEEILGDDRVVGVKLKDVNTNQVNILDAQGVFVAIGHQPNTNFLKGQVELDSQGYVVVENETKTSVEGVFVAGDVGDFRYRQAVTAAGTGCKAALDAEEFLEKSK